MELVGAVIERFRHNNIILKSAHEISTIQHKQAIKSSMMKEAHFSSQFSFEIYYFGQQFA